MKRRLLPAEEIPGRPLLSFVHLEVAAPLGRERPSSKQNGALTTGEIERQERWLEHFADTFGGLVVNAADLKTVRSDSLSPARDFKLSPESTRTSIVRLGRNKGVGRDGVPCELLEAGESTVACKLFDLQVRSVNDEQWPISWMGGRIVDVYKLKGPTNECDSSRGILLADHMGKSLCEQLDLHLRPSYNTQMPADQYGATSGRGTDFASHIVRSFIEFCNIMTS